MSKPPGERGARNGENIRCCRRISFDEYLEAWLKIATTGTRASMRNQNFRFLKIDQQGSEWKELPASQNLCGLYKRRDWETEVDSLVAWTQTLSVKDLDGELPQKAVD